MGTLTSIQHQFEFYQQRFEGLELRENQLENKQFEACEFYSCDFTESTFLHCQFVDCLFQSCTLNLCKLHGSSFNEVEFDACKITGVNWAEAEWPRIILSSLLSFSACNLSHSSFYSLALPELVLKDCKAHDVDFRECDLSRAVFTNSDLEQAQFMRTQLAKADFRGAYHYVLSPVDNQMKGTQFSFPDVVGLLKTFDITIDNLDIND